MSSTNTNDYRDSTGAFKYAKNENLLWPLQNVLRHLSLSRTAWLAGVKSGKFPQPIRLSTRRVAWRSSEIIALIDKLGATDNFFNYKE
jgi:prophage regulatory protein